MSTLLEVITAFLADRVAFVTALNNCPASNMEDYWRWQGNAEARRVLRESLERDGIDLTAEPAPVASRDQLARVLDPDIFDESKPRSKHQAAVIQIAARQHMAYQGADRLLAAGVFRELPTHEQMAIAVRGHTLFPADEVETRETCACGWRPAGNPMLSYSEHARHVADAVLALIGGDAK